MHNNRDLSTSAQLWIRVGQCLVGAFFLASAYWKLTDSFFFYSTAPLSSDWQYWMESGLTLSWYAPVLRILMPYADHIAVVVIITHAVTGLLLVLNTHVRLAAILLLSIQINIFAATFWWWGFFVIVGYSIWLGTYYLFLPSLTPSQWRALSLFFIFLFIVLMMRRWIQDDPWTTSFLQRFTNFQEETMSVHPALKNLTVSISTTPMGRWIWASMWWLQLSLLLLFFTRYRLLAAISIEFILIVRGAIWMSVMGAEATIHVLAWFCFIAEELRQESLRDVDPLLPNAQTWLQEKKRMISIVINRWCGRSAQSKPFHVLTVMRLYPIFLGIMAMIITIFFALPDLFGLQHYNQWGGMYDERWCNLDVFDGDPSTNERKAISTISAGFTGTWRVFSGPMNNEQTCLMWAASRCGTKTEPTADGIVIRWAVPYIKGHRFIGLKNVCDLPLPDPSPWFKYAR